MEVQIHLNFNHLIYFIDHSDIIFRVTEGYSINTLLYGNMLDRSFITIIFLSIYISLLDDLYHYSYYSDMVEVFFVSVVSIILAYLVYIAMRRFLNRTGPFWIKMFFPVGYALYKTRLGYFLHLRKLKQENPRPHCITSPTNLSVFTILPIAVLKDNYSYLIIDTVTNTAVAVDPCDPSAVMKAVVDNGATLKAILTTHRHWDHAGGNMILARRYPDVAIYGSNMELVPGMTHQLKDNEMLRIGRLSFQAIWTPGHTRGHMIYKLESEPPCVFSGDHIFIGGNGQMFEGTPETMLSSIKKMMDLPKNTLIFPGHEYTFNNIKFASQLLPSNTAIQMKWQWVKQQRERELSTVPSILSEELQFNPFMLTGSSFLGDLLNPSGTLSESEILAEVRRRKNLFEHVLIL